MVWQYSIISRTWATFCFRPLSFEQLGVELLDAHADPCHARVPHCVELRPGEQLGHALDRDLDVARGSRADSPHEVHQLAVLTRMVEVRRPPAEVEGCHFAIVEPPGDQLALAGEVPEVGDQLLRSLVDLAREEAEAAPVGVRREAVRRADVDQETLVADRPAGVRFGPALVEDLGDGHVALEPEVWRGVAMEHPVAVPTRQLPVDLLVDALDWVVHRSPPAEVSLEEGTSEASGAGA